MKILRLAIRIIQQFKRDKRSLVLIFVIPLVVLWLFSLILANGDKEISIGIVNSESPMIEARLDEISQQLDSESVTILNASYQEAEELLKESKLDGFLTISQNKLMVKLEGSESSSNKEVITQIQQALKELNPSMDMDIHYLYGNESMDLFDTIGPIFLGFFAFFFVFILSGISFVRERITGTLERILVTPIRRIEIVLGYVLGFGFFAIVQSILITYFTVNMLDMYSVGNFLLVLLVTCLISISALTLGTFLSAFAHNEFQIMQFIPIVIVPQMFFTGLFPVDNLPLWLTILGKLFPLTYGAEILKNVMFKGEGISQNLLNLSILVLFSVVFIFLNMVALKKQRSR